MIIPAPWYQATDPRRSLAAGDKAAYLMLPPETVCGAEATEMLWTADGKTLVVRRNATSATPKEFAASALRPFPPLPRAKVEIVLWSVETRTSRRVYSAPADATEVGALAAMPGTDRLVFTTVEKAGGRAVAAVAMLSTTSGLLTRVTAQNDGVPSYDTVKLSPRRPLGAVRTVTARDRATVRFFGPDGKLGPAARLPGGTDVLFDATGQPGWVGSTGKAGAGPVGFHRIDPLTGRESGEFPFPSPKKMPDGTLKASPEESAFMASNRADAPLQVLNVGSVSPKGAPQAPTILLVAKGGKPGEAGVVTTDGTRPLLSPALNAVAYVAQGSATVRLLVQVPRAAYDQALLDEARARLVSQAKGVGLGLLLYAGDYDDVMPGLGDDLKSKIGPYLSNLSLLDGFTYTFHGGDLASVESPAETEAGFIPGPGGRAVLFVDGHAKWIPDKP